MMNNTVVFLLSTLCIFTLCSLAYKWWLRRKWDKCPICNKRYPNEFTELVISYYHARAVCNSASVCFDEGTHYGRAMEELIRLIWELYPELKDEFEQMTWS